MLYIVFMLLLIAFTVGGAFVLPSILNAAFLDADEMRNEAARLRAQNFRKTVSRWVFIGLLVVVGGLTSIVRSVKTVGPGTSGSCTGSATSWASAVLVSR